MLLSDQLKIPWYLRPFLDALTAILIDLSLDTVAIRLGFWHWSIPLNQEWYGVPFDNFMGWILVVLVISFILRFIRTLNFKRVATKIFILLSPILSYIILIFGIVFYSLLSIFPYKLNNWTQTINFKEQGVANILYLPEVQLWKLIILVLVIVGLVNITIFAIFKYRRKYLGHFDITAFIMLTSLHLVSLIFGFYTGIFSELPYLGFLAFFVFGLHLLMHFLPYLIRPTPVYVFRAIEKTFEKEEKKLEKAVDKVLR